MARRVLAQHERIPRAPGLRDSDPIKVNIRLLEGAGADTQIFSPAMLEPNWCANFRAIVESRRRETDSPAR